MNKRKRIYFVMTAEQWLGVVVLVVLVVGTLMVVKRFQPPKEDETVWVNDSTKSQFAGYPQGAVEKAARYDSHSDGSV